MLQQRKWPKSPSLHEAESTEEGAVHKAVNILLLYKKSERDKTSFAFSFCPFKCEKSKNCKSQKSE